MLNLRASFKAWVQTGASTASYHDVTLDAAKTLERNAVTADVTLPGAVFDGKVIVSQGNLLSGTATDNAGVRKVQLYDNYNLVASSAAADGVAMVSTDLSGHWSTSYVPATLGVHELVLAVTDTSGNQVKATQTVTAQAAPAVPVTKATLNYAYRYAYITFSLPAHGEAWITVDTLGSTRGNLFGVYGYEVNSYPALVATYGPDRAHQTPMDVVGGIEWLNAGSNLPFPNGYVMHVTNTTDVPFATYMDAQPFGNGY